MRTIQTAKPRPELSKFVLVYAQREMECGDALFSQPDSCALEQGLAFNFDGQTTLNRPDRRSRIAPRAYVFGGLTPPCGLQSFSGHIRSFGVFLKPLSFPPLFGIPSSVIMNKEYDAEDLLGSGILDLWSKLAECRTFEERISTAECYLMHVASRARGRSPDCKYRALHA